MVDYTEEVITMKNIRAIIFGVNIYLMTELQLDDNFIHDSGVCEVLTEINPTLNPDIFTIDLNYLLNLGSFGLSI